MSDTKNRDKAADGGLITTDLFAGPMCSAMVFAARYTHTRNTGGTLVVIRALEQCWHVLDDHTQDQILRECSEAEYNIEDWQRLRDFAANVRPLAPADTQTPTQNGTL